ncbi:MAG: L,D-transpeptidase family protein [Anaerovoracaceae bacterium]|jgi:lipoprotein-anchoring transpeptidase ErfK/SrfK
MQEKPVEGMKKKRRKPYLLLIILIVVICYVAVSIYFLGHFQPNSKVGGASVSGKSPAAAEEMIEDKVDGYTLTLKERKAHDETISGDEIGLRADAGSKLQDALSEQHAFAWPVTMWMKKNYDGNLVSYDPAQLRAALAQLKVTDRRNMKPSRNASVSMKRKDGEYYIIPEYYGTKLDKKQFRKAITGAIDSLSGSVDLAEEGAYIDPRFLKDSQEAEDAVKDMGKMTSIKITYNMKGIDPVKVSRQEIRKWLRLNRDMKVVVSMKQVKKFTRKFAEKYNTAYTTRKFKTASGQKITTAGGYYGWMLDQSGEAKKLAKEVKAGEDVRRSPVWLQTAVSHKMPDYGHEYVEVSIAEQTVWFIKNGRKKFVTSCVSGNSLTGHGTIPGVYQIEYKQRGATLSGQGYSSPVDYWMPFNSDQGLHDATWRSAFGGSIYLGDGSHGCVNLPYYAAQELYSMVHKGTPVIVHSE